MQWFTGRNVSIIGKLQTLATILATLQSDTLKMEAESSSKPSEQTYYPTRYKNARRFTYSSPSLWEIKISHIILGYLWITKKVTGNCTKRVFISYTNIVNTVMTVNARRLHCAWYETRRKYIQCKQNFWETSIKSGTWRQRKIILKLVFRNCVVIMRSERNSFRIVSNGLLLH